MTALQEAAARIDTIERVDGALQIATRDQYARDEHWWRAVDALLDRRTDLARR